MKSNSSKAFRQNGQMKAMKKEFRKQQEQDRLLTPKRSDEMIAGYEFIENFLSRGQQVVQ